MLRKGNLPWIRSRRGKAAGFYFGHKEKQLTLKTRSLHKASKKESTVKTQTCSYYPLHGLPIGNLTIGLNVKGPSGMATTCFVSSSPGSWTCSYARQWATLTCSPRHACHKHMLVALPGMPFPTHFLDLAKSSFFFKIYGKCSFLCDDFISIQSLLCISIALCTHFCFIPSTVAL